MTIVRSSGSPKYATGFAALRASVMNSRLRQRRIPGARVAIIPGAAHGMMNDEPAATVAAVRAFLHDAERAAPAPR